MEPLDQYIRRWSQIALTALYLLLVLFPLGLCLIRYTLNFDTESLSSIFFLVLFKATCFSFLQASLSVASIATFAFFFGIYFRKIPPHSVSRRLLELTGLVSFSISPTLVALSLLMTANIFSENLPAGLWAIILCHFLMNAGFFCFFFLRRLDRFFSQQGEELSWMLESWGSTSARHMKTLYWPVFLVDFKTWLPQVFLWCFMSFAPIVLLSAGPEQNTPELLLYYSLLNDPSGSRMLIVFLLTAVLAYFLNRLVIQRSPAHDESFAVKGKDKGGIRSGLAFLCSVILLFPFLYSLLSPLFYAQAVSPELWSVLFPTAIIFVFSFLFGLSFGVLSLLGNKELKVISSCNFISAPMILLGTLSYLSGKNFPYPLISLGAFLAVFPWFYRQLHSQLERIPEELKWLSLSLNLKNLAYFKHCLWPLLKPTLFRLALLVSLWSLGEYTFSKALLDRNTTLALFIEEKLRRYQFAQASTALALSLLLSVVVVLPLLWKSKKRVSA